MFSGTGNRVGSIDNGVGGREGAKLGWLRPFPAFLAAAWLATGAPLRPTRAEDARQTVVRLLADDFGLSASPSDVFFLGPPPPWSQPLAPDRAWVLAGRPSAPDDVFLVLVERTPEGGVLAVDAIHDVTETSSASERHLSAAGDLAAYSIGEGQRDFSVHLLDAGTSPALPANLTDLERWQLRLTWLQETGRSRGLSRRQFKLDPPSERLRLRVEADAVRIDTPDGSARIPRRGAPTEGGFLLDERPVAVARPGNLTTWAVDRVRALPWFGDERMQVLKAIAYRALDFARTSLGLGAEDTNGLDLGLPNRALDRTRAPRSEPERSWPPADVVPILEPALPDEGRWLAPDNDPFVRPLSDGSAPVLVSFVRTDPDREFSRVVLVAWDSRVVELHVQGGTEEPKSSTGETSTGLIPRDPELLGRVIAAFNGGFQSTHGEFGIMIEGTVLVPPAPYAATVARLTDGATGFGTWPPDVTIPENVRSFRQNLTPLVQDGKLNPYGRLFWGGAPEGWEDRTRTVRSGLCLTPHGHVIYLYGASIDHDGLGRAMQLVACEYGVHLDMNQGHTGLEFYRVGPSGELPMLGMPLDDMWQAEGAVEDAPGMRFRGRRLFKTMQLMNFPRYIRREARDFFYLAERRFLPGTPITGGEDAHWTRTGLREERYPLATARSSFRPEPRERPETKVHALELDPRLLAVAADEETALFGVVPGGAGPSTLVWTESGRFELIDGPAGQGATVLARGSRHTNAAVAALGLRDRFLLYLEIGTGKHPANDGALLTKLLEEAGCARMLLLSEPLPWLLDGGQDLSGHPVDARSVTPVHFKKQQTSGARRIFTETPVVERSVWRPLQRRPPP